MQTVNIQTAKEQLSELVDAATAGEEVLIARAGKPVVRLVALEAPRRRLLGTLAGRMGPLPDDFDAPLPEDVLRDFEGK
jgi:prevent-host-death family protein